jgi:hypothetical protein
MIHTGAITMAVPASVTNARNTHAALRVGNEEILPVVIEKFTLVAWNIVLGMKL